MSAVSITLVNALFITHIWAYSSSFVAFLLSKLASSRYYIIYTTPVSLGPLRACPDPVRIDGCNTVGVVC